jgi:hypothetical protein
MPVKTKTLFLSFMMTVSSSLATTTWEKTTWRGEPAWSSTCGAVRAIVSELRSRLLYLGAPDGSLNVINAPYPRVLPNAEQRWPNQGGHRFWLGPQKNWIWPPLAEWEYSSATEVSVTNGVLKLRQPHGDVTYPPITREYTWEDGRLRCTARWPDQGRAYYGMHVIPVDLPFVGSAKLVKTSELPLGMVEVKLEGANTDGFLPHPALSVEGDTVTLRGGQKVIKLGFSPQTLTIDRRGGWKLAVSPGPHQGQVAGVPDHGYVSQIWVGSSEHDLAELEQLTPYLRGDEHGECSSTIYVEAKPPSS